jgi:hypothetical protein
VIPVHGCVSSTFEVIDKYEQIIKVDEWQKIRMLGIILHVYASFFLRFLSELYKLGFQSDDMVKSFSTLSKEVNSDMENSD